MCFSTSCSTKYLPWFLLMFSYFSSYPNSLSRSIHCLQFHTSIPSSFHYKLASAAIIHENYSCQGQHLQWAMPSIHDLCADNSQIYDLATTTHWNVRINIKWKASISSWVSHRQFKLFMSKMELITPLPSNPFLLLISLFCHSIEKSYVKPFFISAYIW